MKNKERKKEYDKKYYLKNRKRIRKSVKEYQLKNKEKTRKTKRKYRLKNREHIRKWRKDWDLKNPEYSKEWTSKNKEYLNKKDKIKRQNDLNYRLRKICRTRIWTVLKGVGKSASTMELIGCTINELWDHLESKFEPWMTRENYGLWDVDHIKACTKFDLTDPEQQRICFHYSNLQPLEHIANVRKGGR
tara:strand:+ start:67 stop:633 length:567 start_codon:yes stop_codon:yes gene_type:complete